MTPLALAVDRLREAEAPTTADWVEEATGIPGPSMCGRFGHAWAPVGTRTDLVHGREAASVRCGRCGRRGYHWLPDSAPERRRVGPGP